MLYGYEAWSLTLMEERKLRVFENRILRRIFGPKRMGSGESAIMRNFSFYRSPNIVRLRWAGHVARVEEGSSAFKIRTGKRTGKRLLGRPRCRGEDKI